jgi:hypothetical protein
MHVGTLDLEACPDFNPITACKSYWKKERKKERKKDSASVQPRRQDEMGMNTWKT